jgi:hypothetical protein
MLSPYHPLQFLLNAGSMMEMQRRQYRETLLLEDTVPAGQSKQGFTSITNLGSFLVQSITGSFDTGTLYSDGDGYIYIDDGIDYLRGQLIDGNGQRKLFNDYIPFHIWLSPGRRKDAASTNVQNDNAPYLKADSSYPLFYPLEFVYLFAANGNILLDVKNDSGVDLSYSIAFHGIRILG